MAATGRRRLWIRCVTVGAILLSLLLGWELFSSIRQLSGLQGEKAVVEAELESIEQHNQQMRDQIGLNGTDEYIIRYARQKFGWVFPDEIRIIEEQKP